MTSNVPNHRGRVRAGVQACAGHPAVLCYAIGNEIPAPIVRWYGNRRVEQYLERLYAVKDEDPEGLVTYVNYPTTEYLHLPFLDLVCFNVYLETPERLEAYLARLQNIAGDRPLLMGEIGLDSRRNGAYTQAQVLEWQIRTIFAGGCTGAFVFAWTDEWYRGGYDIEDWDFGLTDRQRCPKPALATVSNALAEVPFPRISPGLVFQWWCAVIMGHARFAIAGRVLRLEYPNFEVIVVNDGSTDATPEIGSLWFSADQHRKRGLSHARNYGLAAAGDIVAYIDDDAYPDPHWLTYIRRRVHGTPMSALGDRICRRPAMVLSPTVWRTLLAVLCTCSSPIRRPSISRAVTWLSESAWPSGGLIPSFVPRAMT